MSIAFDRFCLIVSLTMPYAVELSVRIGVWVDHVFDDGCVGSRTRDRGEAGPALMTKAMSRQGKTYARAARDGVGNVRKSRSLLHLTSKE
jgi:hypothetical protein